MREKFVELGERERETGHADHFGLGENERRRKFLWARRTYESGPGNRGNRGRCSVRMGKGVTRAVCPGGRERENVPPKKERPLYAEEGV